MKRRKFFSQLFKAAVAVATVPLAALKAKPWIYDVWYIDRQKQPFFWWHHSTCDVLTAKKWMALGIECCGTGRDVYGETIVYVFRQKVYLRPEIVAKIESKYQKEIQWDYPVICENS